MRSRLSSVIEGEIIPRLMLAHRTSTGLDEPPVMAEVDAFLDAVLSRDPARPFAFVDRLRAEGTSVDAIFLGLLAPAARRLGELWSADVADFMEVTVALTRLQQILRELTPRGQGPDRRLPEGSRRILLIAAPGERHTFGLSMVEKFFRGAGWDVASHAADPHADAARAVRRDWYAIVGFSLSCEVGLEALTTAIRRVRKASRNEGIGILVGGEYFVRYPEKALLIGADATAPDGPSAVVMAQSLLDLRARAC
ncbi:cobalamin B12-binding domain-containing protein [Alsobacter sp. R-9]